MPLLIAAWIRFLEQCTVSPLAAFFSYMILHAMEKLVLSAGVFFCATSIISIAMGFVPVAKLQLAVLDPQLQLQHKLERIAANACMSDAANPKLVILQGR